MKTERPTSGHLTWKDPEPIKCCSALDFLAKLDPSCSLWTPFEYGRWAFRGQADASWDLIPRAFRKDECISFRDPTLRAPLKLKNQKQAEWNLLADFIELADEIGFQLPGDLSVFRFPCRSESPPVMSGGWPLLSILEITAIAQHHGVPTRLLDFTFNPLVAAYFAASKPHNGLSCIAVWAVDVDFIRNAWAPFETGIRVLQVPRGSNPFLHAQSGIFIYDASENGSNSLIRKRILDHDIDRQSHIDREKKNHLSKSPRIQCITIEACHRQSLLDELAVKRVTKAHLQPTLDNVVKQLWDRIDSDK